MYDTPEEAEQKLRGSVVCYNNQPVYICRVSGNKKEGVILHFEYIPFNPKKPGTDKEVKKEITDPHWDFRSIGTKIGYTRIFFPDLNVWDSIFLSRIPIRHPRQGLDNRTVQIKSVSKVIDERNRPHLWEEILSENCKLVDTFTGRFTSLPEACSTLLSNEDTIKSIPINRRMCLIYDQVNPPNIIYRGEKIGYSTDGDKIILAKHKRFLSEELADVYGFKVA